MATEKIVVGVDDSAVARHTLAWAMDEAELRSASLVAVHSYHYPWAPAPVGYMPGPTSIDELGVEARARVDGVIEDVMKTGGWTHDPEAVVRFGPRPAAELCDEAKDASMLVVGQRGSGGFLGLRLGSVSEGCLHHAPTTVVIVPEESAELGPPKRITVGVDGSDQSIAAVQWAADEGRRHGVAVVALMTWNWLGPPLREIQPVAGWDESKASAFLDTTLARAECESMEREVVNGPPARSLIERSATGDLVVVGANGASTARGVLAGSVSRQLAHHAVAPIVIVR